MSDGEATEGSKNCCLDADPQPIAIDRSGTSVSQRQALDHRIAERHRRE